MAHGQKANQRTKYHGIGKAADILGCSRVHLWLVLERPEDRPSVSLKRRWRDFIRSYKWTGKDWVMKESAGGI
jgi:hypothetical protein